MSNDILPRYERAQTLMQGVFTNRLARNTAVFPHWIDDTNCFWYVRDRANGKEFRLVDAVRATNAPAFDHNALAKALGKSAGQAVDAGDLPLKHVVIALSPARVGFQSFEKQWEFDPATKQCQAVESESKAVQSPLDGSTSNLQVSKEQLIVAPDGKTAALVRDHNLWLRDLATGKERAVTQDGRADYSYARDRSLEIMNDVQVSWSPDSKRLLTVILDSQGIPPRTLMQYVPPVGLRPQTAELKWPYPGDEQIETYRLVVIDAGTGDVKPVNYPAIPLITYGELAIGFLSAGLGWWSSDSRHVHFVDVTRGSKEVRVVECAADTGSITRTLIEETSDTFVKLRHSYFDVPQFVPLPETNELVWFSERSGWTHLYLYDLATGKLKQAITSGDWAVRQVLHFDKKSRDLIIQTSGRYPDISPYYRDVCRVNIDTGKLTPIATGNFEHCVYSVTVGIQMLALAEFTGQGLDANGVSPSGDYVVTTRSRVDTAPVSLLLDRNGKEVLMLETADVSKLPDKWQWPEPVKLKSADGHTDIYGVVYRPPGFSKDDKYPVIDYSCSMRSYSGLPQGSFVNSAVAGYDYLHAAALASLGFVVVSIDGRGLPLRNKAFQDHGYGVPALAGEFTDRMAGMRQLKDRYPYMDLDRVGLTGLELSTNNIFGPLLHPDFYKVCVVHSLVDSRFNVASLTETWDGTSDKASVDMKHQPEDYVESLTGKLLLLQGMLAFGVPSTFRLVEALQKANKDFDMLCLPCMTHQLTSYTMRREWDYLVKHLLGLEPPKEFQLTTGLDLNAAH